MDPALLIVVFQFMAGGLRSRIPVFCISSLRIDRSSHSFGDHYLAEFR